MFAEPLELFVYGFRVDIEQVDHGGGMLLRIRILRRLQGWRLKSGRRKGVLGEVLLFVHILELRLHEGLLFHIGFY